MAFRLLGRAVGAAFCLLSGLAHAAGTCEYPRMLIVLDKSSSMTENATPGQTKWSAATNAINNVVGHYGNGIHFGLMIFPSPNQCSPGEVKVDVGGST